MHFIFHKAVQRMEVAFAIRCKNNLNLIILHIGSAREGTHMVWFDNEAVYIAVIKGKPSGRCIAGTHIFLLILG